MYFASDPSVIIRQNPQYFIILDDRPCYFLIISITSSELKCIYNAVIKNMILCKHVLDCHYSLLCLLANIKLVATSVVNYVGKTSSVNEAK